METHTRAAIYARMSTDKQSERSPEDQVAECRRYAERQGWQVIEELVVRDAGISGASRHNRPRLLELMARVPEFDVLLAFDFSRLARNQEDLGWIRNRLQAAKKTAVEASTGRPIHDIGARVLGVLNEEYLSKLKDDVRRGLRGRVERGLSAGSPAYGYRTEPVPTGRFDAHGAEIPDGYRLLVDEAKAAVVRRIFDLYLTGDGFRAIAYTLNKAGITSPRRKGWSSIGIREMLRNPIYRGEYVWGRSEWVKDHETGKRRRFERPESEWVIQRDETWRIVSDALWERAQAVMERRAGSSERRGDGRVGTPRVTRSRHTLSGLLECGDCGGSFFALRKEGVYGCGWARDRGPDVCASHLRVPRLALEERVVGAIRDRILTPESIAYVVEKAMQTLEQGRVAADPEADRRRLAELDAKIERAVELAIETGGMEAVKRKLASLRAEREQLVGRLRVAPQPRSVEALRDLVVGRVMDFREAFSGAPEECRRALRSLLDGDRMRVYADEDRTFRIEGLFRLAALESSEPPGASSERFTCRVAGDRYTPVASICRSRSRASPGRSSGSPSPAAPVA